MLLIIVKNNSSFTHLFCIMPQPALTAATVVGSTRAAAAPSRSQLQEKGRSPLSGWGHSSSPRGRGTPG